jgi:EAL domain-containing protein (putative c-di-GMP-specific phosphodiesterase class I)
MTELDYRDLSDRCKAALAGVRVHVLSLHDFRGDVLFLSEGVLGPDEHGMVAEAVTSFSVPNAPDIFLRDQGDGRTAIALAAFRPDQGICGLVLMIVDARSLNRNAKVLQSLALRDVLKHFAQSLDPPPVVARPVETLTARLKRLDLNPSPVAPGIHELKDALRRVRFELYIQQLMPIVPKSTPALYEVLLRSEAASILGEAPHDLIRAAVEHGLGSIIDRRVLVALADWLKRHRASVTAEGGMLSVNLTATSLHDAQFGRFLERVIRTSTLPKGLIAIELDAALCLQYRGAANLLCATLEHLGCPIVLDNFEPYDRGFDLLRLPGVRVLKLSPSIMQSMRSDAVARAVVAAVVQASRVLGLQTVAKHGNPAVDAEWLKALGIDFLQSDSATKPRPLHSFVSEARSSS